MARVRTYRVLDRDYPYQLRDLARPPDPLCIRGELVPAPTVAIVGTRKPSRESLAYAHALAFRLARRGVTVWSGGAEGIDAAAHRGALDAGGRTVAVVGTGLEHCFPREHAPLYEEIVLTGGALVSPFASSQRATTFTFLQRNPVLVALTQATVVVQSPIKSGARSTAGHARRLGRPLFVVPAPPWDGDSAGNLAEIALGGAPLVDERHLLKLLGAAPATKPRASSAPPRELPELSGPARQVAEAIFEEPRHLDDLCMKTGLPAALVQEALLTLTLEAVLVEGPAGWFRRAK